MLLISQKGLQMRIFLSLAEVSFLSYRFLREFLVYGVVTGFIFFFFSVSLQAAPRVEVWSSQEVVERGDVFQLWVRVETTESLCDLRVVPLLPAGFVACPVETSGVRIETSGDSGVPAARIPALAPGSELTVIFEVFAPGVWKRKEICAFGKRGLSKMEGTYTTEREKRLGVNVFYRAGEECGKGASAKGPVEVITRWVAVRATTDMWVYLVFGLLGVVIGHVVKSGAKDRKQIEERLREQAEVGFIRRLFIILRYIFVSRLVALFTTLILGFGVLIVLSRKELPVNTWDQALALGMGLALLADEELLSRIRG